MLGNYTPNPNKKKIAKEKKQKEMKEKGETEMIASNEQKNNNCFSYTYLVKTDKKVNQMTMQEDEVSELMYISIDELEKRMKALDEEISFVKKEHVKVAINKIKNEYV